MPEENEFESIVGDIKAEHDQGGRVALILMFDRLPGVTDFELNELARMTYYSTRDYPHYVNLTVTTAFGNTADQIEEVIRKDMEE